MRAVRSSQVRCLVPAASLAAGFRLLRLPRRSPRRVLAGRPLRLWRLGAGCTVCAAGTALCALACVSVATSASWLAALLASMEVAMAGVKGCKRYFTHPKC